MRPSKGKGYGRALLFERLEDRDPRAPEEPRPFRTHTSETLKESVRRELGWLLNTRCPIPADLMEARERTVINYGIPDLSLFAPESREDHRRLTRILSGTIATFEPRLREVRVTVEHFTRKTLSVRIDAALHGEDVAEPVSFRTIFSMEPGGAAEVEPS